MRVLHVDANSAYLSWTAVDLWKRGYPLDLRTVPAVIAGDPENRQASFWQSPFRLRRIRSERGRASLRRARDAGAFGVSAGL